MRKNHARKIACLVAAFIVIGSAASIADVNWDGDGDDQDWGTVENWSTDTLPTYGTPVGVSYKHEVYVTTEAKALRYLMNRTAKLTIESGGSLTTGGNNYGFYMMGDSSVTVKGTGRLVANSGNAYGAFNLKAGSRNGLTVVGGEATVRVTQKSKGDAFVMGKRSTLTGDFTATGMTTIQVKGAHGNAILAGTYTAIDNGVAAGTYDVITALQGITGSFSTITLPEGWTSTQTDNTFSVTVAP